MNIRETEILRILLNEPFQNQRALAERATVSLGAVNKCLKALIQEGYLDEAYRPTEQAIRLEALNAPKNAIILAAGFGPPTPPFRYSVPPALYAIDGEPLIERLIRQLHEAGVTDITVVVGFLKERFEYLIDAFGVRLRVNPDYARKNNLSSLALVADRIGNTYILPSDVRCAQNPFRRHELHSWYMVSDATDAASDVRVNRKGELVRVDAKEAGSAMIGIAYLNEADAKPVREAIEQASRDPKHDAVFWEIALYCGDRMRIPARVVSAKDVLECSRALWEEPNSLNAEALRVIGKVFSVSPSEITDVAMLKKGMTNRSFRFAVHGERFILRVPGAGTEKLINRAQEAEVYRTIRGRGLCDDPIFFDPKTGYKITRELPHVRVCDPNDAHDLNRCMEKLRAFHGMRLSVSHRFDLFGQIEFYESLRNGPSVYADYETTKANVLRLKPFLDGIEKDECLTHIDAVPDNFLFYPDEGGEALQLTDWEYAGMQDPHVDVAMFCIYSLYSKEQTDRLIDLYFRGTCDRVTRAKLYAYLSVCGLLWSNWCEYKRTLGVEFGEYSLRQYRYAKEYYRCALLEMGGEKG